jgi:hypothetical protein
MKLTSVSHLSIQAIERVLYIMTEAHHVDFSIKFEVEIPVRKYGSGFSLQYIDLSGSYRS